MCHLSPIAFLFYTPLVYSEKSVNNDIFQAKSLECAIYAALTTIVWHDYFYPPSGNTISVCIRERRDI